MNTFSNYITFTFLKKYSYLRVFLFILIFWFLLFITSGSLFSGFHFTDDHEIVHINYNLTTQRMSFFEVINQWIVNDLNTGRFRFFYYIHRIIQTKLFGLNFVLWSIYTGLLAVFTTFFLFIFGRLLNFSIKEALIFSFLITLGSQSAIWWQLGPAETIGTFFLSAATVLAVLSEKSNQYKILGETSFIASVLMMSLSKESFILVIPAIAFIKIWLSRKFRSLSWVQALQKNYLSISVLGLIFIPELLFIKFKLGLIPDIGYAGVEKYSISQIIGATQSLSQAGLWWIVLASLLAIIILRNRGTASNVTVSLLNFLYVPVILLCLAVAPQILLYAKSGISQRYIVPGIIGYAFLIIELYRYINKNYKLVSKLILCLILISLSFKLSLAWESARTFTLEGKSTNALLQTVEANTEVNDPILLITNPTIYYEWNLSIKKYLNYVSARNNLYLGTYSRITNKFARRVENFYEPKTLDKINDKREIKCIITFPEMKKIFLKKSSSWFEKSHFKEYEFSHFNRNLNKNSKIYLYCKKEIQL